MKSKKIHPNIKELEKFWTSYTKNDYQDILSTEDCFLDALDDIKKEEKKDNNLNESSFSRVWQHFNDKDTTVVIFTAFRNDVKYEDNIKNNKSFAAELKNNKFGYFYVEGYFPENEGTDNEVEVKEESIFAISSANKGQDLISLAHKLANSANQDSIIVKDAKTNEIYFLDKNGEKYFLEGKIKPGALGKYYTKLRNKKTTNTFVFENEKDGKSFFKSYLEYIKAGSV